jgi:hypothetical protein
MKIVIWGHKLSKTRHTQAYIHYGFSRAFAAIGHEVSWLDNDDDVSGMNFDNCTFLTEGQVDGKIPLNKSCRYVVHNGSEEKYTGLHKLNIQIFHNAIASNISLYHPTFSTNKPLLKINDYTYVTSDTCVPTLYQPWATDLLPDEIKLENARNEMNNRECVWVGSYGDRTTEFQNTVELDLFFEECRKNDMAVTIVNPWTNPISNQVNRRMVNHAFMAPSIQGPWQVKYGYAPQCRILKNISYGHMGITNNHLVNSLFDNKLVCDEDCVKLFYKSLEKKNDPRLLDEIRFIMSEVKEKHTFVNRAETILGVLGES